MADIKVFPSGAQRDSSADQERYDLISPLSLRRVARTCAEGAQKYGEHNWLKGIPASDLLNHALRHLELWWLGDQFEDHLAHAAWNILALIHFEETRPDLVQRPFSDLPAQRSFGDFSTQQPFSD